jgi:hypothetical protein
MRIDICTGMDQHTADLCMSLLGSTHQSRLIIFITRSCICSIVEKEADDVLIPSLCAAHQRGAAVSVRDVDICTLGHLGTDFGKITGSCCIKEFLIYLIHNCFLLYDYQFWYKKGERNTPTLNPTFINSQTPSKSISAVASTASFAYSKKKFLLLS